MKALIAAFALASALPAAAAPAKFEVEAPPGWEDVTASKSEQDLVVVLKGPETSSFILARVASANLDNRGAVRAFLVDMLTELNKKSGLAFTIAGNVEDAGYDNGAAMHFIRAELQGKPRLIVGVIEFNGAKFLGTLNSAVPDTLLPSIIGSLKELGAGPAKPVLSRHAVSTDGQLGFSFPEGMAARSLTEREKKLGFVLAVQGLGSELMVMKIADDTTPIKDQPKAVRATVSTVDGMDAKSIAEPVLLETPAGPDLVYSSGRLSDGSGQFAAGYMPWCYWGYSVLVKGPRAVELIQQTFKLLDLGSGASPKLVAAGPEIPMPHSFSFKRFGKRKLIAGAAAGVVLLGLLLFRRKPAPREQ